MHLSAIGAKGSPLGDSTASSRIQLGAAEFAVLMAACGPFEKQPHVAVGVSGGPDSLALMLLLDGWVRSQGGGLTALTVDHGLRPESAAEARVVAAWSASAGIEHRILSWTGSKPRSGIQQSARQARYDLMADWCRTNDILHLATAHQLDDQRETVAMRRARGGADQFGAAGISLVSARQGVRLLRPLLSVPGAVLKAYLRARDQRWIDDPSNSLEHFERIRWRHGLEGPLPLPGEIEAWGNARAAAERAVADLLVRSTAIHAAGFAQLDLAVLAKADIDVAMRAVGQLIAMIAGRDYLPPRQSLLRATRALLSGQGGFTLGGSMVAVWRGRGLICREAAAVKEIRTITGPVDCLWDRRFRVTVLDDGPSIRIEVLGEGGVAEIGQNGLFQLKDRDIPAPARQSLPAVRDATGRLSAVPHLGFDPYGHGSRANFRFRPHYSVTSSGFTVAHGWPHTI